MVNETQAFEVQVVAHGDFEPTIETLGVLGDALERQEGIVDPILTIDSRSGTIEISLEVEAADEASAAGRAFAAIGDAMRALGLVESWRAAAPREVVLELSPA